MAVLSTQAVRERLKLPIDQAGSLVITPKPREDAFDDDSVDLRLGTHFLLPQIPPQPYIDPGSSDGFRNYLQLHVPLGDYFVLPAHQTVLGATLEYIKLPDDLSGEILTKSSVARTFMLIETAPWIHPSFRGCLTLEIANASNTAIILYPGIPIGQLILMEISGSVSNNQMTGSYVGSVYPEIPRLSSPQRMLTGLGFGKYRRPVYGWVDNAKLEIELSQMKGRLSNTEFAHIREAFRILKENGAVSPESPANNIFE